MTKLSKNNPQGTANIADDRMLATVVRPQMANEANVLSINIIKVGLLFQNSG